LGIESSGQVAVLEGIAAGEEVVTSAQFLVDSESKLREATAKMMDVLNSSEGISEDDSRSMKSHKGMDHDNEEMTDHSQVQMESHADMEMSEQMDDSGHGVHDHD
jgi:Cu(I)/Ag(I) efflux system membrane fusion protein